jgi:hypothetical protein
MSLALVGRGEKRLLIRGMKKSIADRVAGEDYPRPEAQTRYESQRRNDAPVQVSAMIPQSAIIGLIICTDVKSSPGFEP